MKINVYLERRPESLCTTECQVEKVVELPAQEFDAFTHHPLEYEDFIAENKKFMFSKGIDSHCLLVLGQDRIDGVLVNSERTDSVRYAAFLPSARVILNAALEQAAELIAGGQVENAPEGCRRVLFAELYDRTGLVVRQDNGIGTMLMEKLLHRPEIAEVRMTGKNFEVVLHPEYGKRLSSDGTPVEGSSQRREQIAGKLIAFLAEHDGSEELYQLLHSELGLTHEEIESMGFDLYHRYEEEPGLSGQEM